MNHTNPIHWLSRARLKHSALRSEAGNDLGPMRAITEEAIALSARRKNLQRRIEELTDAGVIHPQLRDELEVTRQELADIEQASAALEKSRQAIAASGFPALSLLSRAESVLTILGVRYD